MENGIIANDADTWSANLTKNPFITKLETIYWYPRRLQLKILKWFLMNIKIFPPEYLSNYLHYHNILQGALPFLVIKIIDRFLFIYT